ncbi:protein lifeguard 1-like isoform X2 [Amphiura filiformis]|uniref:protein lifeguard 1-like isoform X2 n=1 Tax=Amphiura filiformis TaxID=82378 RepID=UPI003B2187F5
MSYNDLEAQALSDEGGGFEFSDTSIRHGFIRKVYAILSVQLVITVAIICGFNFSPDHVQDYLLYNTWVFWTMFAITFVIIIALSCGGNLRRKFPVNLIALLIFTVCEGVLLGIVCLTYNTNAVLIAAGITGIMVIALTIFAFQTKIDFTMLSGILFVLLIGLIIFGIFALIFQNDILNIVYASLGAIIFSVYLVFDTQMMLGGSHKYSLSPEEYIFAALNLYVDIVQLFLYILMLVGRR